MKTTANEMQDVTALREARRRAGLPAEILAARAGVTVGWLRTIERAPALMSTELGARLAQVLGVDVRSLMRARGAERVRSFR